jgi:GTP-binding protein EngB required for normal cell division
VTRTTTRAEGGLQNRLRALRDAVDVAEGRLPTDDVEAARAVVRRAGRRLELGPQFTVAAFAGATGGGKSSLFNALAGEELAPVGVLRPTTGSAQACCWGRDDAGPLLDWLGVARRHRLDDSSGLDGLVVLDMPDHDSTEASHRIEVDRLVEIVDLFVWVVDPQKYADAALHDRYLKPLAGHSAVTLVALNHSDELDVDELAACMVDLRRLLSADGLRGVEVIATSARTGRGIDELRRLIRGRVEARRSALERLDADARRAARALEPACTRTAARGWPERRDRAQLVATLADAAGVDSVATAVAGAHRHRASLATGWPFTRWLRRLRPDPLRRLHLGEFGSEGGASSLPPPSPVQRAAVAASLRALSGGATAKLSHPWPHVVRRTLASREPAIPERLDRAVTTTDLGAARRPSWWGVIDALQRLLAAVTLAGLGWLGVLFVIGWLRLPDPPTPEIERVPLPTALFLGGIAFGLLLALIARVAASLGARRRVKAVRRRLLEAVGSVAETEIIAPVRAELEAHQRLCDALQRVLGEAEPFAVFPSSRGWS